jgi:hypothetical protein
MIARIRNLRPSWVRSSTSRKPIHAPDTKGAAGYTNRRLARAVRGWVAFAEPSDPRDARCARRAFGSHATLRIAATPSHADSHNDHIGAPVQ